MIRRSRRIRADIRSIASRLSRIGCSRGMSERAPKMVAKKPGGSASPRAGQPHALHAGLGIDIDEAPVDLAPRRPLLERRHGRPERRVVRAPSRRSAPPPRPRPARARCGQRAGEEGGAARPGLAALLEAAVELADAGTAGRRRGSSRSRARRRRARPGRRAGAPAPPGSWKARVSRCSVSITSGGRVEPQLLGIAVEIGDGDEQVERLIVGQQRRRPSARSSIAVERVEEQVGQRRRR